MFLKVSNTNLQSQNLFGRPVASRQRSLKILFITTLLVSTLLLGSLYINTIPQSFDERVPKENFFKSFRKAIKSFQNSVKWPTSTVVLKPRILLWNPFFSNKDYLPRPLDFGCSVDCLVTSNRSQVNQSDAIIFHLRNTDAHDLPPWVNGKQRWVLFNMEAPPHTSIQGLKDLERKIHWTASYRKDSDIFVPYGRVVRKRNARVFNIPDVKPKSNLVCWIVSNCNTPSHREKFVDVLKRHIPSIEIYGRCGDSSCSTDDSKECYEIVSKSCKFYLSFENSLCRDYMTEKIFNALMTDMVPVVMGGADYSKFLPNHSFIDALSYDDPEELAKYLIELDKDEEKYMEYLSWKKYYEVEDNVMSWSCDLCKMLHNPTLKWTTQDDLVTWWFDNSTCFNWMQYSNNL